VGSALIKILRKSQEPCMDDAVNGVIFVPILAKNALIRKKYDPGHAGELVSSNRYFQTTAAITAPMTGATINSQSCDSATPPATTAGPRLRAGFTEVPVMGIVTIWIMASASPIAIPAKPADASLLVAPKMTIRKIKVITTSAINADAREYPPR
jgi:hypothetical protein